LKKGVKAKEHEKLDEATISRVISLLNSTPPITKKEACEILNISYNTTRLTSIINEHQEKLARRKSNYEKKKGKPLDDFEISMIVKSYLQDQEVSEIAASLFRSPSLVSKVLENLGVPRRPRGKVNYTPTLLPDECVLTETKPGDLVWSAFYDSAAEVIKQSGVSRDGSPVYQIYVFQESDSNRRAGFYANQKLEELGSLEHLKKYVSLEQLTK
jgi:hypothetical protein